MATHPAAAAAASSEETGRLYAKYGRQLYRYCLARLDSPEEAEDAVQNTFIRVHDALAKGAMPRLEAAWLYKIATNVCLTRWETNVRRADNEQPTDFTDVDLAAPEAGDALYGLEEALASMPKNLRDAILLREWKGLSYAEIADSLDTSVSAVETRIFRARRHLASRLHPSGLLDLGTLYGAVRVLLARLRGAAATAGPAKVAVAAAALAVGGAGVSTAVTNAGDRPSHHAPPAPALALGAAPVSATQAHTVEPKVLAPAAVPATTFSVTFVSTARTQTVTSATSAAPAAEPPLAATTVPAPAEPAPAPAPVATPIVAAPAPATPSPATPPATTPMPTPTAVLPVSLPAVTAPVATTPAVTTPVATVPPVTIQLPTVQMPTLPVTISVPTLP